MSVLHEVGHLIVARLLHIPVKLIAIGLGPTIWQHPLSPELQLVVRAVPTGLSVGVPGRRRTNGEVCRPIVHDILMSAGGPLANAAVSAFFLLAAASTPFWPTLQVWLIAAAILSGLIGLLNLIPLPGLDGGHLLVLSLAQLGLEFTPRIEANLHRYGLRLAALGCLVVLAGRLAGVN